jgi:hypothetical protein
MTRMGAPRVSVVIPSLSSVSRRSLASLDQQTLRADEFEVLVGDDAQQATESARLADLAAHRTNVRPFETSPDASPVARCRAGVSAATGGLVLLLQGDRVLTTSALASLCTLADKADAEVCIGLTGRAGQRPAHGPVAGSGDETDLPPDHPLREDLHGRVVRRELLAATAATDEQGPEHWAALATDSAARVAAVATRAVFVDGRPRRARARAGASPAGATPTATATSVAWNDGVLVVDLRPPGTSSTGSGRLTASLFSEDSGVEWSVPPSDVDELPGGLTRIRFDADGLLAGNGLPSGIWWPTLRWDLGSGPVVADVRLGSGTVTGASCGRRALVAFARKQRLGIDVGGVRHQLVRRVPARGARVVEDARGSLLTAAIPGVEVRQGVRLEGTLRLGSEFPVKAWLEQEGSGARLTAWVSGLPGSTPLFTRFTPAPHAPARAVLVIGPTGDMEVRRLRRTRRRPARTVRAAPAGAGGRGRSVVRRAARVGRGVARRARSRFGVS